MALQSRVVDLFPTPLWMVDYEPEVYEPLNAGILRALDDMVGERPPVPPGGTLQTDTDIHTFDEFAQAFARFASAVEGALKFLDIAYENFEFTGSWININPPGGLNTPHTHPNNYLSGVYYVQTDAGQDSIFFADPRPQAGAIAPPVNKDGLYTGNEARVDAREGRLIMFPAWLTHGVPVNRGGRDRISIAFNVMFTPYVETMSPPKWRPSHRLRRANAPPGPGGKG